MRGYWLLWQEPSQLSLSLTNLRVEAPALRLERVGGKQLLPGVLLEVKGKESGLCTQLAIRVLTRQAGVHLQEA